MKYQNPSELKKKINMKTFITELKEHQEMIAKLADCTDLIELVGQVLIETLKQGGKILLCGNGGSAADCQHIAAELVVQYQKNRQALAAIALTTDSSILTAHSNDFGFETVYSRQIEAIANEKDCLIAISTSGTSKNILKATEVAKANAEELAMARYEEINLLRDEVESIKHDLRNVEGELEKTHSQLTDIQHSVGYKLLAVLRLVPNRGDADV